MTYTESNGRVIIEHDDEAVSAVNPLPVTGTLGNVGTIYLEYQAVATVPTNTITTVLNYTNAGTTIKCQAVYGSGTANAEWFIYIDDVLKVVQRTTAAEISKAIPLYSFTMVNGVNIKVKVKHYRTATQDFECSLSYER